MKLACSMGLSAMTDWMVWLPTLSRYYGKWPHVPVTKCTHLRVVGLRLEGNFVTCCCCCCYC